jgi:hypothetical protein
VLGDLMSGAAQLEGREPARAAPAHHDQVGLLIPCPGEQPSGGRITVVALHPHDGHVGVEGGS